MTRSTLLPHDFLQIGFESGIQSGVLQPSGGLGRGLDVPHTQYSADGLGIIALAGERQRVEPFHRGRGRADLRQPFGGLSDGFPERFLSGYPSSFDGAPSFHHNREYHLGFGSEPVLQVVAITSAALLVNFISPPRDHLAQIGLSVVLIGFARPQLESRAIAYDWVEDQPRLPRIKTKAG